MHGGIEAHLCARALVRLQQPDRAKCTWHHATLSIATQRQTQWLRKHKAFTVLALRHSLGYFGLHGHAYAQCGRCMPCICACLRNFLLYGIQRAQYIVPTLVSILSACQGIYLIEPEYSASQACKCSIDEVYQRPPASSFSQSPGCSGTSCIQHDVAMSVDHLLCISVCRHSPLH